MTTLRVPLNPDTVTVNGDRVRVSLDRFLLLQFDRAIVRDQSTLMLFAHGRRAPLDHHLDVPWLFEGEELRARVRPRTKFLRGRRIASARFVPDPSAPFGWSIEVQALTRDETKAHAAERRLAAATGAPA